VAARRADLSVEEKIFYREKREGTGAQAFLPVSLLEEKTELSALLSPSNPSSDAGMSE
jgi:hypothetical protein